MDSNIGLLILTWDFFVSNELEINYTLIEY